MIEGARVLSRAQSSCSRATWRIPRSMFEGGRSLLPIAMLQKKNKAEGEHRSKNRK